MVLCFAPRIVVAVTALFLAGPLPAWAQNPATTPPPAAAAKPDAAPPAPAPGVTNAMGDPFGEDTTLTAKPMIYVKGSGSWDKAFDTISNSYKTLKDYLDKQAIKADGQPMTIFTATDDAGFEYQAAIPIAEAPKNPPHGPIAVGSSPAGHALKFVYRGSYDALENTYDAITNYLDERRLDAKDMYIEQYVTDPLPANQDHLVINIYVVIK